MNKHDSKRNASRALKYQSHSNSILMMNFSDLVIKIEIWKIASWHCP